MREAVGGSLLMYLTIFLVGIIIVMFVSMLSYSKAYRVKNRIVDIIDKYEDYNEDAINDINSSLNFAGYSSNGNLCSKVNEKRLEEYGITDKTNLNDINGYDYCIYKSNNTSDSSSYYYVVVTFVHFDFPIISNAINIPVYSETKILNKKYNY